jgi:hypothetical protein
MKDAFIGNAAVDTLQIAGNAVTVPVGGSGYGSIPTYFITLDVPGKIYVSVTANVLAQTGSPAASFYVRCKCNGQTGPTVGISMPDEYSGSATAIAIFSLPAGTHSVSGDAWFTGTNRTIAATGIFAMGIQR